MKDNLMRVLFVTACLVASVVAARAQYGLSVPLFVATSYIIYSEECPDNLSQGIKLTFNDLVERVGRDVVMGYVEYVRYKRGSSAKCEEIQGILEKLYNDRMEKAQRSK